jgi:hypothetical protein
MRIAKAAEAGDMKAALFMTALLNCGQLIESQSVTDAPLCELCARRVHDILGGALVCFDPSLDYILTRFHPLCAFCVGKPDREIFDTFQKLFPQIDWLAASGDGGKP